MVVLTITMAFMPCVSATATTEVGPDADSGVFSYENPTDPVNDIPSPPLPPGWSPPSRKDDSKSRSEADSIETDDTVFRPAKGSTVGRDWDWAQTRTGENATTFYDTPSTAGVSRVVTDTGKARMYDPATKTLTIKEAGTTAGADGETELEIRLINATPDLGTFTEIFEITAPRDIVLDSSRDFLATWTTYSGEYDISGAEWFVREERPHLIEIPVIEYRDVVPGEYETEANETIREPYIAGTATVERYWPEWVPFTPDGQTLRAGETRMFKVVYTKPAETGLVRINTAPVFRGVECPEMTWWNTSWVYRVPITVANPSPVEGYAHCEVVSYRAGMQSDFDDVRFTTDDGIVLDYWKETYTASGAATVWVNLPAGATSLFMYYGNAAATDIGSRSNAYLLYDDFDGIAIDSSIWTETVPGGIVVSNGWAINDRYSGSLISNANIITDSEPVIVEMHLVSASLPLWYFNVGTFPLLIDSTNNGMFWYGEYIVFDRRIVRNSVYGYAQGINRGLTAGGDYCNTWIVTPTGQTHSVSGSASYTDTFSGATGITAHRMSIFGGDDIVAGRDIRIDYIRARKYVSVEPSFSYGTPGTILPLTTIAVSPTGLDLVEGETCQFNATAFDLYGEEMSDIIFTWASSNETVGTITGNGVFTARNRGTTEISATNNSVSGVSNAVVNHTVTVGFGYTVCNWSEHGWYGWSDTANWTNPIGACAEYGPVMVDDHGEHGVDVTLSGGAVIASVEHEFFDPSGIGWDSLDLVGRVGGSNVPSGRWMSIEVNGEVVYSESGFSSADPENAHPKTFHAEFNQSDRVRVKISHGQNPAWGTHFAMDYHSLELLQPDIAGQSGIPLPAFDPVSCSLILYEGWNLVSVPLWLENGTFHEAISSYADYSAAYMWDSVQQRWVQVFDVTPIVPLEGFYILANSNQEIPLHFRAEQYQTIPTRQLNEGRNIIGFWGLNEWSARDTLISLGNAWHYVEGYDPATGIETRMYNGGTGIYSDQRLMYPGKGYFVYMTEEKTLIPLKATKDNHDLDYPQVGVAWVDNFDLNWHAPLSQASNTSRGFYNTLGNAGWIQMFEYGDHDVRENHFTKGTPITASEDWKFIDGVDVALFAGHGSPTGLPLSALLSFVNFYDCQWGDDDLEWIFLHGCHTTNVSACFKGYNPPWTMNGVHLVCGFNTVGYDWNDGTNLATKLLEGQTVKDAWFNAIEMTHSYPVELMVFGENETFENDHIWGRGSVIPDPPVDQYCMEWNYTCQQ